MSNLNSMFGRRPLDTASGRRPGKMPSDACDPSAPAGSSPRTSKVVLKLPADFTKGEAADLLAKLKDDGGETADFPAWLTPLLPLVKQFLIELLEEYLG